jgi:hypothetical protein
LLVANFGIPDVILMTINMRESTRILLGLHKKFKDYNTLNKSINEVYMDNHRVLVTVSNIKVSKGEDMWTLGTNQ